MIIYTKSKLTDFVEDETGVTTYWFEKADSKITEYILITPTYSKNIFSDNSISHNVINYQWTFFTKKPQDLMKINSFMNENFNSSLSVSYADNEGYFLAVYDVDLIIKDWS